jgi:hypothetical protein
MSPVPATSVPVSGTFICARCIGDDGLKSWIRANVESPGCSFCDRRSAKPIAADADELALFMEQCIDIEFEDAAEMVPWDEGEYVGSTKTTEELLLYEIGVDPVNEEALDYLIGCLPDKAWVDVDYFSLHPHDTLAYGWERFARAVKHETRYLFFPSPEKDAWPQHDEIRPEQMLDELGAMIRAHRLVKTIRPGTALYRVRAHGRDEQPISLSELASPPAEYVRGANRMSPAGISMLYVATTPGTAVDESRAALRKQKAGTLATFETAAPLRIADFVRLPARPEFFSTAFSREARGRLQFLHRFAEEISQPLTDDHVDQIEYVPTQVITEYLRFRFRWADRPIDGIRYRSAKRQGGVNVALFFGNEDFAASTWSPSARPAPLRLVSHQRVSARTRL